MTDTAHVDTFARDHLPPRDQWPDLVFDLPELRYPERQNCATELLDRALERGWGERTAILTPGGLRWSYADLTAHANRIARVLVEDLRLVPGNRVLLRGPNSPMMAACWFAVMKAGGIAVATMPLLRAKELTDVVTKAQITHALCDARLAAELDVARAACPTLSTIAHFETAAPEGVEARAASKRSEFANVDTAADDTALIAFTSGTTGQPKGTMHFHRDVLAACDCWPRSTLRATGDDIFTGSPPLAFTFGLGGLLLFPLRAGARRCCWRGRRRKRCCRRSRRTARRSCSRRRRRIGRWRRRSRCSTCRRCANACRPAKRCPPRRASCGRTRRASR